MTQMHQESLPGDTESLPEDPVTKGTETPAGGADDGEVVPKHRFNGLMAAYQRDKAQLEKELAETKAELERIQKTLNSTPSTKEDFTVADNKWEEVEELRSLLINERLERLRAQAVAKYPEVAPFIDLVDGDTPEEFEALAAEIANRVKTAFGPKDTPADKETFTAKQSDDRSEDRSTGDAGQAPPPTAPAPHSAVSDAEDRIRDAISRGDFTAYIQALADRTSTQV